MSTLPPPSSEAGGGGAMSQSVRSGSIAASTSRTRQSSFAQGSQSSRAPGGSEAGFNLLKPDNHGLDEGLITEIAKLREFMRKEEELRLGIRPASTDARGSVNGEDAASGRLSRAETVLDKDRLHSRPDYDPLRVERKLYEMKCDKLCVSPVGAVIRHCGDNSLDLKYQPIGPRGAEAIAAPLLINTTVVSLNLKGTGIEDAGFKSLVTTLAENNTLQELNVAQCNLTIKSDKEIGQLLLFCSALTKLDISGNNLGDSSAEAIACGIKKTRTVHELNMADTGMGSRGGEILGPALGDNDTLSILDLSWNHISLRGAIAIAAGIKKNGRLQKVNLAWNGFGHEGAVAISEVLKSGCPLLHLDLSHNRIGDSAAVAIASAMQHNEDLMLFNLSHNFFTIIGILGILEGIRKSQGGPLEAINFEGMVIDDKHPDFKDKVKAITDARPHLDIRYDYYPIPRTRADLLLLFFKKLEEKKLTLADLFKSREEWTSSEEEVVSKEEFILKIQNMGIELPVETLYKIGNQLDIHDANKVSLSLLNTRHEQFENGEYKADEEFPFPDVQKKPEPPVIPPNFLPPAGLAVSKRERNDSATTKRASFSTTGNN